MITNDEYVLVLRVLDDIRRDFPQLMHPHSFHDELFNLIANRVWEVTNNIEQKYLKEFDEYEKGLIDSREAKADSEYQRQKEEGEVN